MKIESVDFFYLSMPEVTTEADGSQDALLVRVVADAHDTSVVMIERTYSRFIGDHTDALLRAGMFDTEVAEADGKIVSLRP